MSGLDGLRAIAVVLVLIYHLTPTVLPGGFLGVDVFFAISGFLITTLLLREKQQNGKISLASFWLRRARRLLPALAVMLLFCSSLALLLGGDLLVDLGAQVLGALFFVSNWVLIATGTDYFTRDTPELFRNTWSLGIEEQFYLVLPLLLLLLLRVCKSNVLRAAIFLLLAALSALLMSLYVSFGVAPTRIYFGLETHIFGLLLGAFCALLTHPLTASPNNQQDSKLLLFLRQVAWFCTGAVALAVVVYLAFTLAEENKATFQWGFQLASVAAVLAVVAVSRTGSVLGKMLDVAPLRWIGERSYGIYLWHWPVMLLASYAFGGQNFLTMIFTLLITVAAATLSYTYIETPVRRHGFKAALRLYAASFTPKATGIQRVVAIVITAFLLVSVPSTVAASLHAPDKTSAEAAIARGQKLLQKQDKAAKQRAAKKQSPKVLATPLGTDISAIGDSVMLASAPELNEKFPGISVDAAVSRSMYAGDSIIKNLAASGALRHIVVVGLATNGTVDPASLDSIYQSCAGRPLVLVNAHGERAWIPPGNQTLADFAASHRGVVVANWDGDISTQDPSLLAGDGIHPNPSGGAIYADAIAKALGELQKPAEAVGYEVPLR